MKKRLSYEVAAIFNAHKRRAMEIAISEVDFIEGLPFESGRPIWLDFTIFDFFITAGDQVEPVAVKR